MSMSPFFFLLTSSSPNSACVAWALSLAPSRLFQPRICFEEISYKRGDTSVVPTIYNPVEVTYLRRSCQNTARRLTHHCWVKEDKNSWSQEACWSQNNYIINHAQDSNYGSSSQQAANGGGLKHSLPIVGAQVDELGDTKNSERTLRGREPLVPRGGKRTKQGPKGKRAWPGGLSLCPEAKTPCSPHPQTSP